MFVMWKRIAVGTRGGVATSVRTANGSRSTRLRLGVVVLTLLTCQCAAFRPLVFVSHPSTGYAATKEGATKRANDLIAVYNNRSEGVSRWLIARRIAEAFTAGGVASALVGTRPEDPNEPAVAVRSGSIVASAGLLIQVLVDKSEMERRKEAYIRGAAALNCALATTSKDKDGKLLFDAIHAVESGVAAVLGFDPGESSPGSRASKPLRDALNEDCLSRLFPAAAVLR